MLLFTFRYYRRSDSRRQCQGLVVAVRRCSSTLVARRFYCVGRAVLDGTTAVSWSRALCDWDWKGACRGHVHRC